MEYLVVKFVEERDVIVNDAAGEWVTNEILDLEPGTYVVTLAPPRDFTPSTIGVVLKNTAVNRTKTIVFKSDAAGNAT